MPKRIVQTSNAPAAIGPYSQAVKAGSNIYISGQVPLDPETMKLAGSGFREQATQVFENLKQVVIASSAHLDQVVKVNIYVTDISQFAAVNEVMAEFFNEPYPARAAVEVSALPAGAQVEAEAVVYIA